MNRTCCSEYAKYKQPSPSSGFAHAINIYGSPACFSAAAGDSVNTSVGKMGKDIKDQFKLDQLKISNAEPRTFVLGKVSFFCLKESSTFMILNDKNGVTETIKLKLFFFNVTMNHQEWEINQFIWKKKLISRWINFSFPFSFLLARKKITCILHLNRIAVN